MSTFEKRLPSDQSKGVTSTLLPLRRRLTSRLQPLHGGLGFGASAIRERAMSVARQSTQKQTGDVETRSAETRSSVSQLSQAPGSYGYAATLDAKKVLTQKNDQMPLLTETDLPDEIALNREAQLEHTRSMPTKGSGKLTKNESKRLTQSIASPPSIKTFIAASRHLEAPTIFQSLMAWFFDALVILGCMIVGFILSASVPFTKLLALQFPSLIGSTSVHQVVQMGSLGWMVLMLQTLTIASIILFFVQAFAGVFLSASLGRAIANIRIASGRSALERGFKIGLGELFQWPLAFGLLNAIVSPEHNFIVRSVRWARNSR